MYIDPCWVVVRLQPEDRHSVIDPWGPNNDMAFLAVYDGHGGSPASAEYAKANLHDVLLKHLGLDRKSLEVLCRSLLPLVVFRASVSVFVVGGALHFISAESGLVAPYGGPDHAYVIGT